MIGNSFVDSLFLGEMRLKLPCVVDAALGVVAIRGIPRPGVVTSADSESRRNIALAGFTRSGVSSLYFVLFAMREGVFSFVSSSRAAALL